MTPNDAKMARRAQAMVEGAEIARRVFDDRSRGRTERNVEIHVSEYVLGALLAHAFELGNEKGVKL